MPQATGGGAALPGASAQARTGALTAEEIGKLAWNAGIHDAPTMARAIAVALAESGGRPDAHNNNASTGDDSYGLWQINMRGSMGPARRAQLGIASNAALLDPQTNAKAMWAISNHGKNWSPWSTFKTNAYLKYMSQATAAAQSVMAQAVVGGVFSVPGIVAGGASSAAGAVASGVGSVLDVGGAIGAAANTISQTVFKAGLNAGAVVLALVLVVLGVVILLRAPLEKAAKLAPVGRAVKVVKAA
jgi:hypothetical protein